MKALEVTNEQAENSPQKEIGEGTAVGKEKSPQNYDDTRNAEIRLSPPNFAGSGRADIDESAKADIADTTAETNNEAEKPVEREGKPYSTKRAKSKLARHHAKKHKPKSIKHHKQPVRNSHAGKRAR